MKLKRFAAAALAFCLMLTVLPGGAEAVSGNGWELSEDGEQLTVTAQSITTSLASGWSAYASGIRRVVIGPAVTSISGSVFAPCGNLVSFEVEEGNTKYSSGNDGVLYTAREEEIVWYPAARVGSEASSDTGRTGLYIVPASVVMVQFGAFSGLTGSGRSVEIYARKTTIESVKSYVDKSQGANFPSAMIHPYVPVESISLNKEHLSLAIDAEQRLSVTFRPAEPTFQEVIWTSEDTGIATVDGTGMVRGVRAGTVSISATVKDEAGTYKASCMVTVEKRDVSSLKLTPETLTLAVGDTETLNAAVEPDDATYKTITFFSTDENVVEIIEEGSAAVKVRAAGTGAASIVAVTQDGGRHAVCKVLVPEVALNVNDLTLRLDQTGTLYATALPEYARDTDMVWSSDNTAVAEVNQKGEITPLAEGETNIKVTVGIGGKSWTDECAVTVLAVAESIHITPAAPTLTMYAGENTTLTAAVTPADATNGAVIWSSSDKDVATVSGGTVTAVAPGKAVIVASTQDGGLSDYRIVTVWDQTTEVKLNKNALVLTAGESEALAATVDPNPGADPGVEWSSDKEEIATVDASGVVHAHAEGSANITAMSRGKTATCDVTVKAPVTPVTSVALSRDTLTLRAAEGDSAAQSETLEATVYPQDASNKAVTWESTDPTVAKVGADGTVTAVASGTATIIVTTVDGRFKAMCAVTVPAPTVIEVNTVTVSPARVTLTVRADKQLTAAVTPQNATYRNVTWSSSDDTIATVNETGVVTAAVPGTAAITATAADGRHAASCIVTVVAEAVPATGVTLDKTTLEINVNESALLTATLSPATVTDQTVTWSSSKPDIADVDQNGIVTAKAPGEADITASAGTGIAHCTVTVRTPANGVKLEPTTLTLAKVGDTAELTATVTAASGSPSDKNVNWRSSDESVATVSAASGGAVTVTAKGAGKATIIAVSEDGGHIAACVVIVPDVSLIEPPALPVGGTAALTAVTTPAGIGSVSWSSSNRSVAAVDSDGVVTANAAGTAEITATFTVGDISVSAKREIEITANKVTHISLDKTTLEIDRLGNNSYLTATVETSGELDAAPTLTATSETLDGKTGAVVETAVSGNDVIVTARRAGTALVTVSVDGEVYSATCVVTVPPVPVSGVSLDVGSKTLAKGGAPFELTATVTPADATDKTVTWFSSDESVATVNDGVVTVEGAGKATITVVTMDGVKTDQCEIIVPGIELSRTELDLSIGETEELVPILTPTGLGNVVWTSDKENVATVSGGRVTAVSVGTATITATVEAAEGVSVSEKCVVTVSSAVTGVTLNENTLTMYISGRVGDVKELIPTVEPDDAPNRAVTWSSTAAGVATVENGYVRAISAGVADITVTAVDGGRSATCRVTVWNATESLELSKTSLTLAKNGNWTLEAFLNEGANPAVTWEVMDGGGCVAVTDNGLVRAISAGTATVRVTAADNGMYGECLVTVPEYEVSDTIKVPTMTISDESGGRTVTLTAEDTEGIEIWYYTTAEPAHKKYSDPIPVNGELTIMAYARLGDVQSAVITGVFTVSGDAGSVILTDTLGNTVDTVAEAIAGGSVMANVTLSAEAAREAANIYLAVYNADGALLSLKKYEAKTDGTDGQVISQPLELDIPAGTTIGKIQLMVLSADKAPVMSAGTLGG